MFHGIKYLCLQIFITAQHLIICVVLENLDIILISNQHTNISGQISPNSLLNSLVKTRFRPNHSNTKN